MAKRGQTEGLVLAGTLVNLMAERLALVDKQGRFRRIYKPRGSEAARVITMRNLTALEQELKTYSLQYQSFTEAMWHAPGEMKTVGRLNGRIDLVEPAGDTKWLAELRTLWRKNIDELAAEVRGLDEAGLGEQVSELAYPTYAIVSRGVATVAVLTKHAAAEHLLVPARPSFSDGRIQGYSALMPARYLREKP